MSNYCFRQQDIRQQVEPVRIKGQSKSYSKRKSQAGMSSISFVLIIALAFLLLTCTLKMLPAYIQNWNVQSVLDSVQTENSERTTPLTKAEIRSRINKRLNINQITALTSKQVAIEKTAEGYIVIANYEVREQLFSNIDGVMKFDNSVALAFNRQQNNY